MRQVIYVPTGPALFDFSRRVWNRYTGIDLEAPGTTPDSEDAERAIAYIDRIIDRQINKSNGILTFNSILIALLSLEDKNRLSQYLLGINFAPLISILLLFSSLIILYHYWIHWDKNTANYSNFSSEFQRAARIASRRSRALMASIALSIFCVVSIAVILFIPELISSPTNQQENSSPTPASKLESRLNGVDIRLSVLETKSKLFEDRLFDKRADSSNITNSLQKLTDAIEHLSPAVSTTQPPPQRRRKQSR